MVFLIPPNAYSNDRFGVIDLNGNCKFAPEAVETIKISEEIIITKDVPVHCAYEHKEALNFCYAKGYTSCKILSERSFCRRGNFDYQGTTLVQGTKTIPATFEKIILSPVEIKAKTCQNLTTCLEYYLNESLNDKLTAVQNLMANMRCGF